MEVIDKNEKRTLSIYLVMNHNQNRSRTTPRTATTTTTTNFNYEHPNTYSGSGSGSGSYLDRASLTKQFGDFQDYKKQYTVHFSM
jgi:hypothetical protein